MINNLYKIFNPIITNIKSKIVEEDNFRLDSQYYILFKEKYNTKSGNLIYKDLIECCDEIYEVPPFKHIYVTKENGIPFYTSSGLFEANLEPSHYLTTEMKNIDTYKVKEGQILMARSGDVTSGILGMLIMVGKKLNGVTTSDHVLRFTPNTNVIDSFYLYAFLMSDFCKGELLKNAAGAVIPAIRPDSLKKIKVPIPTDKTQKEISVKMKRVIELREEAIGLFNESNEKVLNYNRLPRLFANGEQNEDADIITNNNSTIQYDYRLDAHFYNPTAELVINKIVSKTKEYSKLSKMTSKLFYRNRFTRTFVEKEYGIPYLAGKDIIKIKPDNLNYLSETETKGLDAYKLHKGWIMVTCSGTIGRSCLIWNNFENYVGTHDLIRIELKGGYDFGYVYAFLNTVYGINQILKFKHGAVIDHITPEQIGEVIIPIINFEKQKEIGDLVRLAYEKRAEALKLEDEAQELLKEALTNN